MIPSPYNKMDLLNYRSLVDNSNLLTEQINLYKYERLLLLLLLYITARDIGSIQKVVGAHFLRGTLINKNRQHFKLQRGTFLILCEKWGEKGTCPL